MTVARSRTASPILCLLLITVCGGLSSCSTSPQEHLQGRWYNEELSLRFRSDGTLVYNSTTTGLTTGRYFFTGEMRAEAYDEPVANLTLDLMRGGSVVRSQMEVQFLGDERLRVRRVSDQGRRPTDPNSTGLVVLKRAANNDDSVLASAH